VRHQAGEALAPDGNGGLAERLEAAHGWALLEFARTLNRLRPEVGGAWMAIAGGHAIYTGALPFTLAIGVAMHAAIQASELDEIEEFFLCRGAAPAVDTCPYTHPSLLHLVSERGYRPREIISVLCCDLRAGAENAAPRSPWISLRWAGSADLSAWTDLVAEGFFGGEPGAYRRADLGTMFHVPQSMNVLAFVEKELAGTGCLMLPPGEIAEMFGACTLPRFRVQGVHSAVLQFRLRHARELGRKWALATAIPGGDSERNLQHHGFRAMYEKRTWEKR
jgi:GNAT superfamily N-acetyltransferase